MEGSHKGMDIFCPSPIRKIRPAPYKRWAGYNTVVGKWSTKFYEFSGRVFPDFCLGWGYVFKPKLAGILAHATGKMGPKLTPMSRLEDIFLTGITCELIKHPNSRVLPLVPHSLDWIFQCPCLSGVKNVLFNSVILEKSDYVNLSGVKFY